MPHGGAIVIRAEKGQGMVLIEVTDTGPGIPVEIRDRLFEPWITAGKRNGLGLGLAITREIILAGGGDLWYESGEGTRFIVRLPSA
jgi:signal transduction histidine kinase